MNGMTIRTASQKAAPPSADLSQRAANDLVLAINRRS